MHATQSMLYDENTYTPSESVGYLIRGAWQNLLKNIDAEMHELDLTGMQWGPLLFIAKSSCNTVTDCASASFSDNAAMTRMLDRLEAKGFLYRVRNAQDRRIVNVELTGSGKEIARQIPARLVRVLNHHLQGFSMAELEMFKDMLRRFTENRHTPMEAA